MADGESVNGQSWAEAGVGSQYEEDTAALNQLWQRLWAHNERINGVERGQALLFERLSAQERLVRDVQHSVTEARGESRAQMESLQRSLDAVAEKVQPLDQSKARREGALTMGRWVVTTILALTVAGATVYSVLTPNDPIEQLSER